MLAALCRRLLVAAASTGSARRASPHWLRAAACLSPRRRALRPRPSSCWCCRRCWGSRAAQRQACWAAAGSSCCALCQHSTRSRSDAACCVLACSMLCAHRLAVWRLACCACMRLSSPAALTVLLTRVTRNPSPAAAHAISTSSRARWPCRRRRHRVSRRVATPSAACFKACLAATTARTRAPVAAAPPALAARRCRRRRQRRLLQQQPPQRPLQPAARSPAATRRRGCHRRAPPARQLLRRPPASPWAARSRSTWRPLASATAGMAAAAPR